MISFHPTTILSHNLYKLGGFGVKLWHAYSYWRVRGRFPNFRHPKDLSERILAHAQKPEFKKMAYYADKVKVREYIKSKGLDDHLLKVYGVWDKAEDIDFSILPNKFALKPNNGSGGHFFCHDKSTINEDEVRKKLSNSLKLGHGYNYEPHYKAIEPKIYAEELIETVDGKMPVDYKFHCIKGKIGDVFISCERNEECTSAKYITLDLDWKELPYTKEEYKPKEIPAKPKLLNEMVEIAKILSADFEFVRVDLYEYRGKVYFGELTFTPWGGLMYSYNNHGVDELGKMFNN